jgi:hypothetical protein
MHPHSFPSKLTLLLLLSRSSTPAGIHHHRGVASKCKSSGHQKTPGTSHGKTNSSSSASFRRRWLGDKPCLKRWGMSASLPHQGSRRITGQVYSREAQGREGCCSPTGGTSVQTGPGDVRIEVTWDYKAQQRRKARSSSGSRTRRRRRNLPVIG